jgi:hypothetical protein
MRRRHLYVFMFSVPGLLASLLVSFAVFGAAAGVLWLFVYGDKPWPPVAGHISGARGCHAADRRGKEVLVAGPGALLGLLHCALDLLLGALHGLLTFLELLLLDRGRGGGGTGGFEPATRERDRHSDDEQSLHGEHYRRKRPPRPSTKSSASVRKDLQHLLLIKKNPNVR